VYKDSWHCWKSNLKGFKSIFADIYVSDGNHHNQVRLSNPTVFSKMKLFLDGVLITDRSKQMSPINQVEKEKEYVAWARTYWKQTVVRK